jgi:putative methionine-R-sulfoxide reductase with GAF domain
MKTASSQNELATLSTTLLSNLDEVIFFSKLSSFIQDVTGEYKVLGFEVLTDGSTRLIAENGKALSNAKFFNKGQGLAGYVARMKRAYYSNSVKRDPIASNSERDASVEAELCLPIMIEGSVIGTLNIQSTTKDRNFGDADLAEINDFPNFSLLLEICTFTSWPKILTVNYSQKLRHVRKKFQIE